MLLALQGKVRNSNSVAARLHRPKPTKAFQIKLYILTVSRLLIRDLNNILQPQSNTNILFHNLKLNQFFWFEIYSVPGITCFFLPPSPWIKLQWYKPRNIYFMKLPIEVSWQPILVIWCKDHKNNWFLKKILSRKCLSIYRNWKAFIFPHLLQLFIPLCIKFGATATH